MLLPLVAIAAQLLATQAGAWRSAGTTQGVALEVRDVPGSGFEEIRASAESPESLARVCDAAFARGQRKLDGKLKERDILRETDNERWSYERVGIPVLEDRDYVLHIKLEQPASSGRCEISFETVQDPSRPKVAGVVRIPDLHGHWSIAPAADGKTALTYEIFCNPGGSVPPFLAKSGQRSAAVDLVKLIQARAHGG